MFFGDMKVFKGVTTPCDCDTDIILTQLPVVPELLHHAHALEFIARTRCGSGQLGLEVSCLWLALTLYTGNLF